MTAGVPPRAARRAAWRNAALSLVLALVLWLPRGLALDHFVAVDERSWLTRSGNFYLALSQRDWAATFQRYHPGVVTMWLGTFGFLASYPDYPADAAGQITSMSDGIEDFLHDHGHPPMTMLAAGRSVVVLATVALLVLAFWLAAELIGPRAALAGVLLAGFEPLGLGLSRMLHVDGLSAVLMLVAVLAWLRGRTQRRRGDLVLSGVMAGLAWLTKSPSLMLGPLVALLAAIDVITAWAQQRRFPWAEVRRALADGAIWGLVAAAVFVALWPAMWVDPVGSLRQILAAAGESAAEGHTKQLYFAGQIVEGDPGPHFYPITYLWHTTPMTLLGLALALVGGIVTARRRDLTWRSTGLLALYALAFVALMTLGSKKFPRYLLPAFYPLDLVAGVGWAAALAWTGRGPRPMGTRPWARRWLLPVVLAGQAALALPHFPYYFTYYNPLLGGAAKAPQTLMIGLGEGLDEAARYLNAKPDAEQLAAAAWYRGGSFNYIFVGQDLDIEDFYRADYAVLYAHQWQRQVPDARLLDYFATLTPEYTVTLHGLDYAWVYDLRVAPPPAYFSDWAGAIRLVQTQTIPTPSAPGEPFVVRLRLYVIDTPTANLNVLVRLVDATGTEVARSEGWPFGAATSDWRPGEVYVDGHEFTLPADTREPLGPGYLRVEAGFYDPATQALITPTVAGTTSPLPDLLPVGYVSVGPRPELPRLDPAPQLGDEIRLVGATVGGAALTSHAVLRVDAPPGHDLSLTLAWQAVRPPRRDYTVLLHLIGPDGQLAAQGDRPPLGGVVPSTLWREGETLADALTLPLPEGLAAGEYRLVTGLYDLATLARLPVTLRAVPAGDTVPVATLVVK
jgi:hypothetical protein